MCSTTKYFRDSNFEQNISSQCLTIGLAKNQRYSKIKVNLVIRNAIFIYTIWPFETQCARVHWYGQKS